MGWVVARCPKGRISGYGMGSYWGGFKGVLKVV
jgi:hypothetical protein